MNNNKKLLIIIPYFIPAYSYWWPIKVAYDHAIGLQKHPQSQSKANQHFLPSSLFNF